MNYLNNKLMRWFKFYIPDVLVKLGLCLTECFTIEFIGPILPVCSGKAMACRLFTVLRLSATLRRWNLMLFQRWQHLLQVRLLQVSLMNTFILYFTIYSHASSLSILFFDQKWRLFNRRHILYSHSSIPATESLSYICTTYSACSS